MNQTTTQEVKCFQDKKAILIKKDGSKWSCELARWLKKGEFEKAIAECKTVHAEVEFPNNHSPIVIGLSIADVEDFATREDSQAELEAFSDY